MVDHGHQGPDHPVTVNVNVNEGTSAGGTRGNKSRGTADTDRAPSVGAAAEVVADLQDPVLSHGNTHKHEEAAIVHAAQEVIAAAKGLRNSNAHQVTNDTGTIDPHALHSRSSHRHSHYSRAGSDGGKSHRSRHTHHPVHDQAPVIVPVVVNPPVTLAPVPPPATAAVAPPATVIVNDTAPTDIAQSTVRGAPNGSTDMHLFRSRKSSPSDDNQPLVETTVTTTTTTHTVPIIPGGVHIAPKAPTVVVRNTPPTVRPPSLPSGGSIHPAASATASTVVRESPQSHSRLTIFGAGKNKNARKSVAPTESGDDPLDVKTTVTTIGGPTTAGVGARTIALSDSGALENPVPGTSGGLRPIPISESC